jgi:ribosomal protein L3 glutamine methyltransferase
MTVGQSPRLHHDRFDPNSASGRMRIAVRAGIIPLNPVHRLRPSARLQIVMPKPEASKPRTLRDYVHWAERRFESAKLYFGHGTDNARDEAVWLVAATLQLPFDEVDAQVDRVLTEPETRLVRERVEARIATRKPLAYLLHEAWFAGLRFYVDERVIVPRSLIGEFIHDEFRPWIDPQGVTRILDLCTGSGCIAIAAALAFPEADVDAADISADALAVAERNVDHHHVRGRVHLVQSDLFANLADRTYDLILTNPPYVDADDMATLPAEYRHEPALALASGPSGLDAIIRIMADAPMHLNPGGALIAEVGNSCTALAAHFPQVPFIWLTSASGDESVFLLSAEELARHAALFRGATVG